LKTKDVGNANGLSVDAEIKLKFLILTELRDRHREREGE